MNTSKRRLVFANNPLLAGPALAEREKLASPYRVMDLASIETDASQPRQEFDHEKLVELAVSIRTYGVLNPILVKPSSVPGRYVILAGERRYRACRLLGLTSIPAIVDQGDAEDKDRTLAIQLVENLQRADLTPLERAQAIAALKDNFQLSIRDIAEKLGVSKSMVQRSLDLLNLPHDLVAALKEGASESKILLLAKIDDPELRASYLKDLDSISRDDLSKKLPKEKAKAQIVRLGLDDQRIVDELQRSLGLKVKMKRSKENEAAGTLEVDFYSEVDLQEIFRRIARED